MLTPLEPHLAWHHDDVKDPEGWTYHLLAQDLVELDDALAHAKSVSCDLLDLEQVDFPLPTLAHRLTTIERELIDGRGFVRIRGLPVERYSDDDLTLLYWGIGLHLGEPWPQNKHGHLMGDVTDQGKSLSDPTFRGNELGQVALDYHTDGADLIGLMCLRAARSGGLSLVANAVAIHNDLLATRPDLVAALYEALPYDFRGEQPEGSKPFYSFPVFTAFKERLFVRFIPHYIRASQRHAEAPRLSSEALEALEVVSEMARRQEYNVYMELAPGDMQFINNYHVLHGRTAYVDDAASGHKRHLKRLWLSAHHLTQRPPHFRRQGRDHWGRLRTASHIPAVARGTAH
ncbi:MAG: TauD/TfdA family dioxygenase [Alphaproteobacteria bacterium]|nr:TauD/TfdA family dioxygenase [Alphaproteobacteria bacterium]